ncbi:uncharacterized protein DMAD_00003 [Drosophila madeirensis]|uniref:RNA-directed DNA polymerase n=1 Tax=Drosophila madeirensis TaxID=30013 RepID=A0AAU9FWD6_DROMD
MQAEINQKVDELLELGCIEPSRSPYSSPIVMVKKKTGQWRLCVDFRQVNAKSVKDAYPMPRIDYILDQFREARFISSLDLKDGYLQIPLEERNRQVTAFTVPGKGLYQWKVMPFGLQSASATFQRALDQVIGTEMMPHAFAYQDDIIVIGRTEKEHKENLKEVFRRLREANLRLNAEKCQFFRKELRYLGHKVTADGICTDPEKVAAIAELKPPANVKELRQYLMPHAFAYQDDIIVIGRTEKEHKENLKEVFRRLREANLRLNAEKCQFFRKEQRYLGHKVTADGICTDPEKVAAIAELKPPANVKELRQYLGVASWYRRFVPDFATLVQPLTKLLKKKTKWEWSEERQAAFEAVRGRLAADPVLACPDFTKKFVLQTDASDYGLGAILTQETDRGERVISYASRSLNAAERNYSATEKECLAIVWAVRKLKPYLEGYRFKVVESIESPTERVARWALELQQYDFEVTYRKGQLNVVADALSRLPVAERWLRIEDEEGNEVEPDTGEGCRWIRKVKEKMKKEPAKFPDYVEEAGGIYRNIPHRAGDEGAL